MKQSKSIFTIILAIVILGVSQILAIMAGECIAFTGLPVPVCNVLMGILYPALALGGTAVLCRKYMNMQLEECRITRFGIKPVWWIAGLLMPLAVAGIYFLMPGRWEIAKLSVSANVITGAVFFYGFSTGIVEEMVFRGVIMKVLEMRWNKWIAIVVPSVLFGFLHILGNQLDFLSVIQLIAAGTLVGILFSLIAYESQSIWPGAFVHGMWNIIMVGGIVHIGIRAEESALFNYVLESKSFLITGRDFGVEASAVSAAAYMIFSLIALALMKKSCSVG